MPNFEPSRESQLTNQGLTWGYWWVTHKVRVRRVFSVVMIVVDLALVGYVAYGFGDWYFGSGVRERAQIALLTKNLTDYAGFRQHFAPKDLGIDAPMVLDSGEKTYDLIARATNPNAQWRVEFDYTFGSGADVPAKHAVILPGETQWLAALGVKSDARPAVGEVTISNLQWHRIDLHAVQPDYQTWSAARLNFVVSDAKFTPPAPTDPIPIGRASFTVTNDTAFGYYGVPFFVTLTSGARIVGANQVVISDLRPGDTRQVQASWFSELPQITNVDVQPVLDIFDSRVYIPPGQ